MSPEDDRALSDRLRAFGRLKPTPKRRAEVELMLGHKREGVQSVAAQVLGEWGGPESVPALRSWLMGLFERPYGWAVRGVAARSLGRCVSERDIGWVLDLYFSLDDPALAYELLPLLEGLPREETVAGLRAKAHGPRGPAAERALTRLSS